MALVFMQELVLKNKTWIDNLLEQKKFMQIKFFQKNTAEKVLTAPLSKK